MSLSGKTALVTGGSRGIGAGVVDALREQGCQVAVLARNVDDVECDLAIACDVADEQQQLAAFEELSLQFDGLDYCFINAGVSGFCPLLDMATDEWDRVMNINLRAAFISLREAGCLMRDNDRGGSILACCSLSSFAPETNIAHYNAAKAGLMMLVKTAARECGQYQIRVNGIAPGLTRTDLIGGSEAIPGYHEKVAERTALGRLGHVDDITPIALNLLMSEWVTGQVLVADGGLSLFTPTDPLEHM